MPIKWWIHVKYTNPDIIRYQIWLVVWNHGILLFHSVGNVIIPTDQLIFFRGVGIPPTRWYWSIMISIRDMMMKQWFPKMVTNGWSWIIMIDYGSYGYNYGLYICEIYQPSSIEMGKPGICSGSNGFGAWKSYKAGAPSYVCRCRTSIPPSTIVMPPINPSWVCLKIVYPYTQWLMIIIPTKWL